MCVCVCVRTIRSRECTTSVCVCLSNIITAQRRKKCIYRYILGEVEDGGGFGEEKDRSEIHLGRPHPVRDTRPETRISYVIFFLSRRTTSSAIRAYIYIYMYIVHYATAPNQLGYYFSPRAVIVSSVPERPHVITTVKPFLPSLRRFLLTRANRLEFLISVSRLGKLTVFPSDGFRDVCGRPAPYRRPGARRE